MWSLIRSRVLRFNGNSLPGKLSLDLMEVLLRYPPWSTTGLIALLCAICFVCANHEVI